MAQLGPGLAKQRPENWWSCRCCLPCVDLLPGQAYVPKQMACLTLAAPACCHSPSLIQQVCSTLSLPFPLCMEWWSVSASLLPHVIWVSCFFCFLFLQEPWGWSLDEALSEATSVLWVCLQVWCLMSFGFLGFLLLVFQEPWGWFWNLCWIWISIFALKCKK